MDDYQFNNDDTAYSDYDQEKFEEYLNYDSGQETSEESNIGHVFVKTICPLLVVVGGPLCCWNVRILFKVSDTVLPCVWYLMVGDLVDTLLLVAGCGNCWASSWTGEDVIMHLTVMSDVTCKSIVFVSHLLEQISNWCLVLFVYATLLQRPGTPIRALNNKASYVKDVMVILVAFLMCFNMQYFWTYDLVYSGAWLTQPSEFLDSEADFVLDTEVKHCVYRGTGVHKVEDKPELFFLSAVLDSIMTDTLPAVLFGIYLLLLLGTRLRTRRNVQDAVPSSVQTDSTHVAPYDLCTWTPITLASIQLFVCVPKFFFTLAEIGYLFSVDAQGAGSSWDLAVTVLTLWQYAAIIVKILVLYKTSKDFKACVQHEVYRLFAFAKRCRAQTFCY